MKFITLFFLIVFSFSGSLFGQSKNDKIKLLAFLKGKDSLVDHVFNNHEKYNLEIIFGDVNNLTNDSVEVHNVKLFENDNYFYPASTIKLPCAILALEKLKQLGIPENHYFRIKDEFICGNMMHVLNSNKNKSSFYELIKLMLVVSDNVAYNSIYELLTSSYINKQLTAREINKTTIYKKFAGCNIVENLKFNPIYFYDTNNNLISQQESSILDLSEMANKYSYSSNKLIGKHYRQNKKVIHKPFDFNYNIEASLTDLHNCLTRLVYPKSVSENLRWNIKENDRVFLLKNLGLYPKELNLKEYNDTVIFPDDLLKYIAIGGVDKNEKNNVRTLSKIGVSYGFITETSLVIDFENKVNFFLSARMHVNENQTLNDNIYEYETVAKPFLGKLGQLLIEYQKIYGFKKDLSEFQELFN